jgi:hypothetical protein
VRFIIFVIDDGLASAGTDEMNAIGKLNDELKAAGQYVMAEGIHSGANATVIDNRVGAGIVSAGSLYSEPERYTGFWIIDAGDEDQAHEIARRASLACDRKVELRGYLTL